MIARVQGDALLCEQCSENLFAGSFVGPGKVFDRACPHIEIEFLRWHESLRAKESPLFKHIWQPFCIGFLLGASIVAQFLPSLW